MCGDGGKRCTLQGEKSPLGLSTDEALRRLSEEIETLVHSYEQKFNNESFLAKAKSSFAKPYENPLGWFPILVTILSIVCLFITRYYLAATLLLLILTITIALVVRESNLRRTEVFRKIRLVLNEMNVARQLCSKWTTDNYPNLWSPLSPCVTLQWTYRDGHIVNLPWALLVRGDVLVIRPGQVAPGTCTEISGKTKFKCGETYGLSTPTEAPAKPTARSPLPDLICTLEKTPYLDNLQTILDKFLTRPATIYNQQRYLLITKYIQQWGIICSLVITLFFAALHYNEKLYDDRTLQLKWVNLFLELPVCALLPILPMMFPVMWIAINLWGIATVQTHLAQPLPHIKSEQQKSFQEDLDTPTYEYGTMQLPLKQVFKNWLYLWRGYSMLLGRSANLVQVLGSITALCCVDKKGILSWPNPTAEKVFFLHESADQISHAGSDSTSDSDNPGGSPAPAAERAKTKLTATTADGKQRNEIIVNPKTRGPIAEVLDLTHDQHSPFRIDFDDHGWKMHIDSLKPLGLAILLNTCCQQTQEHYSKFCGHVTAVATFDKDLVPVTNRYEFVESRMNSFMHGRCLCELAKQIGFTEKARDIFNLEGQIASYMHLQPEVVKRDIRFARQLRLASKVKVPFPHCLSVVLRELQSNSLQMLTQGTADIVLDCCDDFWDGRDLRPLGPAERKRAQDFYQRNALTAYCTAFSYRPLRHGIFGALSETAYMELPPETTYRSTAAREHERGIYCTFDSGQCSSRAAANTAAGLQHSISSDSLLFSENNKEEDICDVDGCFEMQCHQVFIGMVTMQYQAQTDVVQLVESLDRACIRFVHFSKENELRSRVFSEKMGLESGWNCHISLLSDDHSNVPSPKSLSRNFDVDHGHGNISNAEINSADDDLPMTDSELNKLLPPPIGLESSKNLSCSAPGAISDEVPATKSNSNLIGSIESVQFKRHRVSKDSAMEDENCRSLSGFTDSTEQSAPVNFDMSNRAKLPRGIENIRPHLENVDNVPLLVSLFTDCSADATREMLGIMQSCGEIVVCLGSSASNANADIFLQADCSIAVEPLYPQVCQSIPAYTETNLLNNRNTLPSPMADAKQKDQNWFTDEPLHFPNSSTVSPIYLSRQLNAIPCSIAVCRDDNISILALIELSRRFSNGLWNCIQFWACCGCTLAIINTVCACLALPPVLTPFSVVYLMGVIVPLLSTTLVRIETEADIMNRATAKKHNSFDSKAFVYAMGAYGCKFLPTIIITILSYCTIMSHPVSILSTEINEFYQNLDTSRCFVLYAIVLHFVTISISFVHRDFSIWRKCPFTNCGWLVVANIILIFQTIILALNLMLHDEIVHQLSTRWPIIVLLFASIIIVFAITEICKWEELKANGRYQRRARLDFGTKLGMNSPF